MCGFLISLLREVVNVSDIFFLKKDLSNHQAEKSVEDILQENLNYQIVTLLPVLFDDK